MKEVNDVREYEDEDGSKVADGLLNDSKAENTDDGAGHHITAQRWAASFFFLSDRENSIQDDKMQLLAKCSVYFQQQQVWQKSEVEVCFVEFTFK